MGHLDFFVAWLVMYRYFLYFLLKPNQQALKRKDSNMHCSSIGRRNNGIISSNNSKCQWRREKFLKGGGHNFHIFFQAFFFSAELI